MYSVEYKFRRALSQMISSGDRILAAVSGGPDSVVMLHLLNKLKSESPGFDLAIAHLNHLSRGADSKRDADFVVRLGKQLNLETFVEEIDVAALGTNMNTSFQETARNVRYDFLNRVLNTWQGNKVALGHNADDQAETVLINLLRGSGLLGLTGIPAQRDHFFRPLLDCFRSEVEDYIEMHDLGFCSDATNQQKSYLRNRIRLELIPFLERYNPQIKASLTETSKLLSDDEDFLQSQVDRIFALAKVDTRELDRSALKIDFLNSQHPALQKRLVRQAILVAKGDLRAVSAKHISDVLRLINDSTSSTSVKEIHLPGEVTAICTGGILSFCKNRHKKRSILSDVEDNIGLTDMNVPGWTDVGSRGLRFNARLVPKESITDYSTSSNRAYLDYDKTGSQIRVRSFRPGDRFVPLGMKGSKKLKSFFIDEKVPLEERRLIPILTSGDDDIIWVYEKRIGENYRVTDKTCRVLMLEGVLS